MRAFVAALVVAFANVMDVAPAQGQSLTTELDLTAGYSSEDSVRAVATQLRAFGEVKAGIRFNIEGTWARRSDDDTDAFGAAYPYSGRVQLSEAYVERMFQRGSAFAGIRLGQYRTPFGIYSRSDHAYSGFLRAPLIRYDSYWSISNNFLERGADVVVGTPRLSVEASVGVPGDIGIVRRRSGVDSVVRAQGYYRAFIVGVSYTNSEPYGPAAYAAGRLEFTGVDARWTFDGIQLRGEWIAGQPWTGPKTRGGYLDAIVHRRFMGPVTAVFRTEQLNYASKFPFSWHGEDGYTDWQGRRQTMGGRIRVPGGLTAQVDFILQSDVLAEYGRAGVDVGLTYSVRRK